MQLSGTFGECSENSCSEHSTGQQACLLMIAFFHNLCFTQGPNIFGIVDRRCHFKHNLMHSQHCNPRPIHSRPWTTIIFSYTDTLHSFCCLLKLSSVAAHSRNISFTFQLFKRPFSLVALRPDGGTFRPAASPVYLLHSASCWDSCRPSMVQTASIFPAAAWPSTTSLSPAQHKIHSGNTHTPAVLLLHFTSFIRQCGLLFRKYTFFFFFTNFNSSFR